MLIFTLNFLFNSTKLLSPIEFICIVAILSVFFYLTAPEPEQLQHEPIPADAGVIMILFTAWLGEMALWKVFWPFFALLNILLLSADMLATSGQFSVSSWDNVLIMATSSSIVWTVAVWRCSYCTSHRIWAALARLITFAAFADFALRLFIRIDYPRGFFNCQELLLDYSGCF